MPFISNTDEQRREMLAELGLTMEGLFSDIPRAFRVEKLDLPEGKSEQEVRRHLARLAEKNSPNLISFLGGGFYDHFIPAAVEAIVYRSEFYTAYTPYQAEISQGTLEAMYEYQSAICRLTEMEVANASLYDGVTAIYEAIMMALRITSRRRIIVDETVNPIYRKMVRSYTKNLGIDLIETPPRNGRTNVKEIHRHLEVETAAVVTQNPNFFGIVEDFADLAKEVHKHGALLIVSCYPISLGLIRTPGEMGADIVVGEGQSLGMGVSFGGPYLGFMATRKRYLRKLPGRLAGRTVDTQGREGFVMTLQAREQHIRREKATSNICTNQMLCALTSLVYLSLMGKHGLRELAQVCADRTDYAQQKLLSIPGVKRRFPRHWCFNEFVLELPNRADRVIRRLLDRGVAAGFPLHRYYPEMENSLLVALTEKRDKEEIDYFAHVLEVSL